MTHDTTLTGDQIGLGVTEAARRLGLSSDRVRALIRTGQLPAVKTPLGSLIPEHELARYAQRRQEQAR